MADEAGKQSSNSSPPIGRRFEHSIHIQQAQRVSLMMTWMRAIVAGIVGRLPRGRPREYDHAGITKVAEELILRGVDAKLDWFVERVRHECKLRHVKAPTLLTEICSPVFLRAESARK